MEFAVAEAVFTGKPNANPSMSSFFLSATISIFDINELPQLNNSISLSNSKIGLVALCADSGNAKPVVLSLSGSRNSFTCHQ